MLKPLRSASTPPWEFHRVNLVLANERLRQKAIDAIRTAPDFARIAFKKPQRSLPQNAKMWAMLGDVARQYAWHGVEITADDWKLIFLDALRRERGRLRLVPNLAGDGFVALSGGSSSDLSVAEMSDVIELLYAWGADPEHPVTWSEPDLYGHPANDGWPNSP